MSSRVGTGLVITRYLNRESLPENIVGEGHNAAGQGIDGFVKLLLRVKVCLFQQWAAVTVHLLLVLVTGQYAASNCKLLLFGFPCNWWHINVGTCTFTFDTAYCYYYFHFCLISLFFQS